MCYSVESSLKTTAISFFSILYLLTSNIPYFKWLGVSLIGWCGMQFDELLLWLTNPRKSCTKWNEIITMTLIPLTLLAQVLCPLWGSLCVFPWNKMSNLRKNFMIVLTFISIAIVYFFHFYKPDRTCTIVTKLGHLNWCTNKYIRESNLLPYVWFLLITIPFLLFWKKSFLLLLLLSILPAIGIQIGKYTDAQGSVWCFYTSYTSIIASIALFLKKYNIYHIF
jgi:hypothetical protein